MSTKSEAQKAADDKAKAERREHDLATKDLDDGAVVDGAAPPDDPTKDERNQQGLKPYRDPTREAIMNKANAARDRQKKADTEALDDEGRRRQAAMEAEARGEVHEYDDEETRAAAEKKAADEAAAKKKKADKPVDSDGDLVTIRVDGEDLRVPKAKVDEAGGVENYQKRVAADRILQGAKRYEESVRGLETRVRDSLETLQQQIAAGKTPTKDDAVTEPKPEQITAEIEESAKKVADAVFSGNPEEVTKALTGLMTSVAQGRSESTPPLDAKQIAEVVAKEVRAVEAAEREEQVARNHQATAERVNTTFEAEFKELYDDDRGFSLTQAEFNRLCKEKPDADRVELMRDAGNAITELLKPKTTPADILEERRNAKRSIPDQPSTSQRVPPEPATQRPKNRSQIVAEMAAKRGQTV